MDGSDRDSRSRPSGGSDLDVWGDNSDSDSDGVDLDLDLDSRRK